MSTASDTPKVWTPPAKVEKLFSGGGLNSNTSGSRTQVPLVEGKAPIQLYSWGTPNGHKLSILLEELGIEYDGHPVAIGKGDQFTSGFVGINPNSKIPALVDKDGPGGKPITIFESAAIMLYLAEKYKKFFPTDPRLKTEAMTWLFWQMSGLGPITGNFGHFFAYAPDDKAEARDYGVARFGMETQRLLSVLDTHLKDKAFMIGEEYSIVDMAILPWFLAARAGYTHKSGKAAGDFLSVDQYTNANTWANKLLERPGVQRGRQVFQGGIAKPWLEPKKE